MRMKLIRMIYKEMVFRWINFTLSLTAATAAVAVLIIYLSLSGVYRKETRKIQLGLGQNLRILHKNTEMDQFWLKGYSSFTMPEEYVYRFASLEGYEYTHLSATLQKAVELEGRTVILTGILPEVMPPGRNQPPMMFSVQKGEVTVGAEIADIFQLKSGDQIELFGTPFQITTILKPSGSNDDIRIFGHLHDVQPLLNLQGKINEIRALECLCLFETGQTDLDPLTLAQQQLAEILPDAKVMLLRGIADVRQNQRAAMESFLRFILPLALLMCGIFIGILSILNVRERQEEIGILRTLGYKAVEIASVFLGKAVLIGLSSAILGFVIGSVLTMYWIPETFTLTGASFKVPFYWLAWTFVLAPLFTTISSFIPAMKATTVEPSQTLRR